MVDSKKISVIIPVYGTEMYLDKCLESVLNQSYGNIEIVVVNDCSPGNCDEIVNGYCSKDKRVKLFKHEKNKGLFHARITGFENSTGYYVAFLDSDDYVTCDYYRTLIMKAQEEDAEITMGNYVLEYDDGAKNIYNLFNCKKLNLKGDEVIREYFNQEGLSFDWHTVANKLYKRTLWEKALPHYKKQEKHLIMTEDFSFSTVLFYYAKSLTNVENDSNALFYCQHSTSSTSVTSIKLSKVEKNLTDLKTSFDFVESFMREVKIYEEFGVQFNKWKSLYYMQHREYVDNSSLKKEEKAATDSYFKAFCSEPVDVKNGNFIYNVTSEWNDTLENIKLKIKNPHIEYVSFDIFDTLIVRPFYEPKDMFVLMNEKFRTISKIKTGIDFSRMRVISEVIASDNAYKKRCEEITFDEIYSTMKEVYSIEEDVISRMMEEEIRLEKRFLKRRNTGYELFTFAQACGKKVFFTSDMYLPGKIIKEILENLGYIGYEDIFVSSDYKLTKATGNLYSLVIKKIGVDPSKIIHIGDNYDSDVVSAKAKGLVSVSFPKAISVATDRDIVNNMLGMFNYNMPILRDNVSARDFVGIRTMIAMVVNKYFDNPFKTFNKWSDFNGDPYLIGYYALGMYVFGIAKWILDDVQSEDYEKMVFMARDGYLPMRAYDVLRAIYKKAPASEYVYVSRKALIPVTLSDKMDFYRLSDFINIYNQTPTSILKYISGSIELGDKDIEKVLEEHEINGKKKFENLVEFNKFIKVVLEEFYDEEKHEHILKSLKKYFKSIYGKHSATFDIGYSGRPELYLSILLGEPIDTYFLNINSDEALKNADLGKFKLKTFFESKPAITGLAYEYLLSKMSASCIGYDISGDSVNPIFEEEKFEYPECFVMELMQRGAIDFVRDVVETFGDDIHKLYYQKEYLSLPIMSYINSSLEVDRRIFDSIEFEDDVRTKKALLMSKAWEKETYNKNQRPLYELTSHRTFDNYSVLDNKSRPIRALYYLIYDRVEFKNKMKYRLKDHKYLYRFSKNVYGTLRNVKHFLKPPKEEIEENKDKEKEQ